eukprot:UN34009
MIFATIILPNRYQNRAQEDMEWLECFVWFREHCHTFVIPNRQFMQHRSDCYNIIPQISTDSWSRCYLW